MVQHSLRVLHFGGQCPWHLWVIEQAQKAALEVGGVVEVFDVAEKTELAERYRLFFPFMTVIDDDLRLPSPTNAERLVKIIKGGISSEVSHRQIFGIESYAQVIEALTVENIQDTCALCYPDLESAGCHAKEAWAKQIKDQVKGGILGFIAYEAGQAIGVVEVLPATLIPYPFPLKKSTSAFITCLYSLSEDRDEDRESKLDYRGNVLEHCLGYLSEQGYEKIQVIAGRRTPYPNGPVPFFLKYGFREILTLDEVTLSEGREEIVLMEKEID